jgi:hypothetical protein
MTAGSELLLSARTFKCGVCQTGVLVCSPCDRGQRYCCANCRTQARLACQRRASASYQSSRAGRFNHARRQQQYRERQGAIEPQEQQPEPAQIVTHQGSPQASTGDVLAPEIELDVIKSQGEVPLAPLYCHWCSRAVSGRRRMGWLRYAVQDEPEHSLNGAPRGQSP